MTPDACLSWPWADFLALPHFNGRCGPCMVITLHALMLRSEKSNAEQNALVFTKKKYHQNAL